MNPGEIRGPIKTSFGYHVIKLAAKTPAAHAHARRGPPDALVRDLAERKAAAETERLARELSGEAQGAEDDSPTKSCASSRATSSPTTRRSGSRARATRSPGIGANPQFSDEAWRARGRRDSTTPDRDVPRGRHSCGPSEERPAGVPALRGASAPRRRGLEGRAAREGRAGEARAGGPGARVRDARSRRSRPVTSTEVKTTPEFGPAGRCPRSGAAPDLLEAVFRTPAGQAGPPVRCPPGSSSSACSRAPRRTPRPTQTQKAELIESLRAREAERLIRAVPRSRCGRTARSRSTRSCSTRSCRRRGAREAVEVSGRRAR